MIFAVIHIHIQSYKNLSSFIYCSVTVEYPLNCRWIAIELIFIIECWILTWMLNFPLNGFLLLNIEYSVECWTFCWMRFRYWILNIILNVEFPKEWCWIPVRLIFIIEHWIFRWLLNLNFQSEFLLHTEFFLNIEISVLKFHYWTLNFC